MSKRWYIKPSRDDMHALQMLSYGTRYRDLNRRRRPARRFPLRWPFGGYRG